MFVGGGVVSGVAFRGLMFPPGLFVSLADFFKPVAVCVDMEMAVCMRVFVGVNQFPVTVLVRVGMLMFMGMLQGNGIQHHKYGAYDHDQQGGIKLRGGFFSQQDQAKRHSEKGSDGIVGAGFGGAQMLLCQDIKIDAEAVGDKAQRQRHEDPWPRGEALAQGQRDDQAACAGKAAF